MLGFGLARPRADHASILYVGMCRNDRAGATHGAESPGGLQVAPRHIRRQTHGLWTPAFAGVTYGAGVYRVYKERSMRAVVQRVSSASVTVDALLVGAIETGFVVLVGVTHSDGPIQVDWMARKIAGLRLFEDEDGKMNLGLEEVGGSVLLVSQFTLYGDARKGRRPSFIDAARPEQAEPLIDTLAGRLRELGVRVETGRFQAMMQVALVNDGPVTLVLDTAGIV